MSNCRPCTIVARTIPPAGTDLPCASAPARAPAPPARAGMTSNQAPEPKPSSDGAHRHAAPNRGVATPECTKASGEHRIAAAAVVRRSLVIRPRR